MLRIKGRLDDIREMELENYASLQCFRQVQTILIETLLAERDFFEKQRCSKEGNRVESKDR